MEFYYVCRQIFKNPKKHVNQYFIRPIGLFLHLGVPPNFFTIVVCCELKKVENHCSRLFFFNGDLNEEKTFCRFFIKASKRDVFTSGDVKSSLFVDIFEKIELFVENKENLRP